MRYIILLCPGSSTSFTLNWKLILVNQLFSLESIEGILQSTLTGALSPQSALAREFVSEKSNFKRYVIGRNAQSREVINKIHVDGIIDDYVNDMIEWQGVPIRRLRQVEKDAFVLNCSTSISPVNVLKNLNKAGIKKIVGIHELILANGGVFNNPWFVEDQQKDYLDNTAEWHALFSLMEDEQSRQTLLDVMRYRLTANPVFMSSYTVRFNEQYFENFMELKEEVFVDAGGFDGDTTEEFCRRYPDYRRVYLFEPSRKNMLQARARLASFDRIDYMELGLSDCDGELRFDSESGSASSVSISGSELIQVSSLDRAVVEPVSFIKMDLEGWEMRALAGCMRHIENDHPKLALSVYHAAEDFRRIPEYVLSLNQNYRVYLRHYSQGWSETVMFFLPWKP